MRDILGYLVIKNNDLKIGSIKLVYSLFMVFCAGLLSPIDKICPQITLNEPLCLEYIKLPYKLIRPYDRCGLTQIRPYIKWMFRPYHTFMRPTANPALYQMEKNN